MSDLVESTEDVVTGPSVSGAFLSFNALSDEMSTSKSTLDISGNILDESVASISINNKQANINSVSKTFTIAALPLGKSINDLVVKVYAQDKSILEKKVITVYSSG